MRWRVIVYGTALLAVLAVLYLSDRDEARRDRKTRLMWRLWHMDAEQLALAALHAKETSDRREEQQAAIPFLPWDEWPAKLRTRQAQILTSLGSGLSRYARSIVCTRSSRAR